MCSALALYKSASPHLTQAAQPLLRIRFRAHCCKPFSSHRFRRIPGHDSTLVCKALMLAHLRSPRHYSPSRNCRITLRHSSFVACRWISSSRRCETSLPQRRSFRSTQAPAPSQACVQTMSHHRVRSPIASSPNRSNHSIHYGHAHQPYRGSASFPSSAPPRATSSIRCRYA